MTSLANELNENEVHEFMVSAPPSGRRHLFCICSSRTFFHFSNLNVLMRPSRHPSSNAHAVTEESHTGVEEQQDSITLSPR